MWKKMRERRTATEEIEDENVGDKVQCKAKNEEKRKINHYRWGSVVVRCLLFFASLRSLPLIIMIANQ